MALETDGKTVQQWLQDPRYSSDYLGSDANPEEWIEDFHSLAPALSRAQVFMACTIAADVPVAMASYKPGYPTPWVWEGEVISDPRYQGEGYGYEAFALGLDHILATERVHKIAGPIAVDNVSSIHVVEKLGFTREGLLREHLLQSDGSAKDAYFYGLLAREWRCPFITETGVQPA